MITKRFCDCCGIEIKDIEDLAELNINCDYNVDKSFSSPTIDLCINCWGSVKNIISNKFQNSPILHPSAIWHPIISNQLLGNFNSIQIPLLPLSHKVCPRAPNRVCL